jgi:pyridoxal phosphate enzyme (YggS family)
MRKATLPPQPAPEGTAAERLQAISARATDAARAGGYPPPALIAISKNFGTEAVVPLLEAGHRRFGENRVQEAAAKWPALQQRYPGVELHMVGQLQSNKAAEAVALFDAIHSVDRPSLIAAIARAEAVSPRRPLLFVQVNLAGEEQKGGVAPEGLGMLLQQAAQARLDIRGLMTVPPADREPAPYFALLATLARNHGLPLLSMGMSADFAIAAALGATHIRVGSALFGARQKQG